MKITLLGSSSFVSSADRFGPSYLIEVDNKKILVDAGSGSQIRLAQLGIPLKELDYIFITHFHPDHTADLPSFFLRYSMIVKNQPEYDGRLIIFGPKGIQNFIKTVLEVSDLKFFADRPGAYLKEITKYKTAEFKVESFKTQHMGITSQGYRFEIGKKTIVFTGDTTFYPDIIKDCINADLLFIDSSLNKDEQPLSHMNTTNVAEVCNEAGVKKVVLCHILEYNRNKDMPAEVKEAGCKCEVILSKDLLEFKL